jgi:hypothetical protein
MTANEMIQVLRELPHNAEVLIDGWPVHLLAWHQQKNEVLMENDQVMRPDLDGSYAILYLGEPPATDSPGGRDLMPVTEFGAQWCAPAGEAIYRCLPNVLYAMGESEVMILVRDGVPRDHACDLLGGTISDMIRTWDFERSPAVAKATP